MADAPLPSCSPAEPLSIMGPMVKKVISHLDESGRARMVDVGGKPDSERWAVARASVIMSPATLKAAQKGDLRKGDLRAVAELAGVMAAKRTSSLIPLCHPLPLTHVDVAVVLTDELPGAEIRASVRTTAKTGVEMEALTAASVAALTVYDMVKGIERGVRITDVRLVEKHGGQSGDIVLED
jgi:cyclic pyranopterin phosphate synthase